jgi:nicotinamide-nucleotide amidase
MEMVRGCIERSGADYAVAVTGIAGPDGGSTEKPVGTVWIGWGGAMRARAQQLYYPFGRKMFQTLVAATAIDLVRREILGIADAPRYFRERALRR